MSRSAGVRALFAAVLLVTACKADPVPPPPVDPVPPPPAPGTRIGSELARITLAAPAADVAGAVASNAEFGLDLMRALVTAKPTENVTCSPYSVSAALAMTYGGSAGATHAAFDQVLHQHLPEAAYHRAMNDLDRQLASRGQGAQGTNGQPFRLDVTNQLFADPQVTFLPSYLELLAQEYGAAAQALDLSGAPEPSRQAINDWVTAKTAGYIKDLLPQGFVTRDTRGVLVNAIYFNARWANKFDAAITKPAPFHPLDGVPATVEMMQHGNLSTQSIQIDGVEVVSLPYDGRELSLMVLMPTAGSFTDWERSLTMSDIARYVAARRAESLALSMPKFTIRTSAPLTQTLKDLGLAIAFSDRADFSRMSRTESLLVTDVVHQAVIIVDESGTVAAAATGIGIGPTSAPPPPRQVVIDRPFLYLVRDEATGAILFLGRYVKPVP